MMTKKFRNKVRIEGDTAYITVNVRKQPVEYMFDVDQLEKIMSFGYSVGYATKLEYPAFKTPQGTILLHRCLTGAPEGTYVDHKDSNPRNNRLSNLHVGTQGDNLANPTSNFKTNTGHKNITWKESEQRFLVKIQRNKKQIFRRFKTIEEAVEFRNSYLLNT
jgi:hypothetical protein